MDKEAQERIEGKLAELYCGHGAWIHKGDGQEILDLLEELGYCKLPKDKPPLLTPALAHELEGTIPEFQDRLAWLLYYASGMGDYGDPHGILAVISPQSGKILVKESD